MSLTAKFTDIVRKFCRLDTWW